jgi:O-antigen/teichoic acid export membrane protein
MSRANDRSNGDSHQTDGSEFWRRRSWWVATGHATAGVFGATALSFIATIVVARALDREAYGAMLLATTTVGALATFLDFSFEEAVVHFGAKAEAEGDRAGIKALLRASLRLDLAIGLAVFGLILLGASTLSEIASRGVVDPTLIRIAGIEVFVLTLNGTTGASLLLVQRPHYRAWMMALTGALRLAAVAAAVAIDAAPQAILWAYVASSAIGAAVQAMLAWSNVRRRWGDVRPGVLPVEARRLVSFGAQSSLTTAMIALQTGLVAALLGRGAGPAEVAVFQVAAFPLTLAGIVTAPIRMTTIAEHAALAARGQGDLLWRSILAYSRTAALVGVPTAIVGWFLLSWLIPALYSERYVASVEPARVLLIAAFALLVTAWAKQLPAVLGKPAVRTAVSIAELGCTAALVAAFASRGALGAAWAVSVTAVLVASAWMLLARRMLAFGAVGPASMTKA